MARTRRSTPGGDIRPFPAFEEILSFMESMREERLALVILMATVAGDDLDEAVERLERVMHTLGDGDVLSLSPNQKWRDIAMRTQVMAEAVLHDLKQVREQERKTDGSTEKDAGSKAPAPDKR